jgi:hypothetical protein
MSDRGVTESAVDCAAIARIESFGYAVLHGPDIAIGEPAIERSDPNRCDVPPEKLK